MSEQLRFPQPVGVFDFPVGLQLVTDEQVRIARLQGRRAEQAEVGDGPIARYNAWVIDPDSDDADAVAAGLPDEVSALVAVVGYTLGRTDTPPAVSAGQRPEVAAVVLASQAAAALEAGHPKAAADLLQQGAATCQAESEVLAAVLRSNALTCVDEVDLNELAAVLTVLDPTELNELRAEIRLRLGTTEQQIAGTAADPTPGLRTAMGHYFAGLGLVTEASAPYTWAMLNLNLATAQLAVPMKTASDQLRLGVATMGLRSARRVFADQQQLQAWSTATLNLANALVYTPSTHQGDNLVEAVELYEEVLASGVRNDDPLGRARLQANLGNVLAHLGVFDQARAQLVEARFVFEEHLDHESAMAVRSVLDEIARSSVTQPTDDLADLARQADQMSRMPVQTDFTAGMNVIIGGPDTAPPPGPTVTVLDPASRPTHTPDPQDAA